MLIPKVLFIEIKDFQVIIEEVDNESVINEFVINSGSQNKQYFPV